MRNTGASCVMRFRSQTAAMDFCSDEGKALCVGRRREQEGKGEAYEEERNSYYGNG